MDHATRYPEAIALKEKSSTAVADALFTIYSRVGIPEEIISDQGGEFVSQVMKDIEKLLGIKHITTTPYHPMCNGVAEAYNKVLKLMLKRMCQEKFTDWHKYIEPLLFAYREVPHDSTGFSPFELLYGRNVRGPMMILKELWTEELDENQQTLYEYVINLKNQLQDTQF